MVYYNVPIIWGAKMRYISLFENTLILVDMPLTERKIQMNQFNGKSLPYYLVKSTVVMIIYLYIIYEILLVSQQII